MTRQALLLYCQSSLGIGHTVRSLRLAAGLAKAFDVQFLNGGEPIGGFPVPPGVRLIQLPPFSTDEEFQAAVEATRLGAVDVLEKSGLENLAVANYLIRKPSPA